MQKNSSSFPVEILDAPFGESDVLANLLAGGRTLIVADSNAIQRHATLGTDIGRYFKDHGLELAGAPVVLAGGEKVKADALESVRRVMKSALEAKIGRNDTVLAIGGGTVLDLAGYVAAQVRGGARIVRMPTTPGAMFDAAFATTASVDYGFIKDALRIPCVPTAVVISPSLAMTVMDGVWSGGLGTAVCLAAVRDAALFKKLAKGAAALKAREPAAFAEAVTAVAASRKKKGNSPFAQWAASRLESMSDFRLPYGYALAIGVVLDCGYAVEKGLLKPEDRDAVVSLLADFGALDGFRHSQHLLQQPDSLLKGLDALELAAGVKTVMLPAGLGKSVEDVIDRDVMQKVVRESITGDLVRSLTSKAAN